jgi:hypothetical protein
MINQMKIESLKDDIDINLFYDHWRKSFNIRRLCIRELQIDEVLERFPGYRRPEMVRTIEHNQLKIIVYTS